jgi:hypothetical protein
MTEFSPKLEITAKVVDLGDRVIQLSHIVSAGVQARYPFRVLGLVLIGIGAVLLAGEVAMNGAAAFRLQSGGSLPLWISFAAAGIGLFLALYARRNFLIRTSDGARFVLPAIDEGATSALIQQLKYAMEATGGPPSGPPQGVPAMLGAAETPAMMPRGSAPLGLPQHPQHPQQAAAAGGRTYSPADQGAPHTAASRLGEGYANGYMGRGSFPQAGGPEGVPFGESVSQSQRRTPGGQQHHMTQPSGMVERRASAGDPLQQPVAREPLSLPATMPASHVRDDGQLDLAALMDHVRRADVQHKEALLDLLRVIEDYYRGRATREEAIAHWRSFADYVVQYLSDVGGLISYTERFGRHMLSR